MKKNIFSITGIALSICLLLTGCGNGGNSDSAGGTAASQSTTTAGGVTKRTIQLGHIDPAQDTDPYHTFATYFAENVYEASGGALEIDIVADAQLGAEPSMMEGMQMGTIEMAVITNFTFSSFVPEFSIFDLPYIFTSLEHAHACLDDDEITGALENALYDQYGIKILAWGEGGFRSVINKKRPIYTIADLNGLKIRVPENTTYLDTFKALGANPTAMASTECFTGLQQGTIDGLENPITAMYSYKFYEAASYVSLTEHFYSPLTICVSQDVWESLNTKEQNLLLDAAQKAAEDERMANVAVYDGVVAQMQEAGTEFNEVNNKTEFRDAVYGIFEAYAQAYGEDILNKIDEKQ